MGSFTLYGIWDGDVMVYVGIAKSFKSRQWLHRKDSERRIMHPLYQLMRQRNGEGRPVTFTILAEYPDKNTALEAERQMIAQIGIVEDGGRLLNERRSGIGPAGFSKAALQRISEGTRQGLADPAVREKMRAVTLQRYTEPEARSATAKQSKERWADPTFRESILATHHSEEMAEKRRAEMQRRWADPVFREKMARRRPKTWTDEERTAHGDKCRATLARKKE